MSFSGTSSYLRALVALVITVLLVGSLTALVAAPATAAGGLRWTDKPTPTDARLRGLAPVSAKVAWVSGYEGTVLRTTDGGRSWTDVSPGAGTEELEFRDIEAWDDQHAVVMSAGEGGDSRIYRTANGGRTWVEGFRNRSKAAFYDCIAFWDRRHGIAMSDPVRGAFRILVTNDGGRSWTPRAGMPPALDGEYGFAASGTCVVTAGESEAWVASGGSAARVFHTNDRGRSWSVTDTPLTRGETAGIFSLAVRAPGTALVAVGGDAEKMGRKARTAAYSEDRGVTWTAGGELGGYRSGVAFLPRTAATGSPSTGVLAVGPTGTDVSYDLGVTWERVDRGSLVAVACAKDGACWASGEDGRVAVLRGLKQS